MVENPNPDFDDNFLPPSSPKIIPSSPDFKLPQ